MSLDLEGKKAVVADVAESISGAQAAILAEYRGLTVSQMTGVASRCSSSRCVSADC